MQTIEAVEVFEVGAVTPEAAIDLAKETFRFDWESVTQVRTEAAIQEKVREAE